jgi:predicted 3-demethylubiquinone-9 3-methyltransferase (glyoxalase superfamily)
MQKITPFLWFDKEAREAAGFYTSTFKDAKIRNATTLDDTPSGIDSYWEKLSADPTAEQCGWLKDKFGLSWQIVPAILDEMLKDKDKKKIARVTEAFLQMKKFDIAMLKRAYEGR